MVSHAILGAALAYVNNGNPAAGGGAAVASEAAATYLTNQYKDNPAYQNEKGEFVPNLLPEDVKTQIRDLTAAIGAVVGGTVGDSAFNAQLAGVVGQNAVENNYLSSTQIKQFDQEMGNCKSNNNCDQVLKKYKDLSIMQQEQLAAVCSVDAVLCKKEYGFIITSRKEIKETLDQTENLPTRYFQGLFAQQVDAEGMIWNTELARQFKEKFGITDEQASYLASVVSGGGLGNKGIKGKSSPNANIDKRLPTPIPTVANNGLVYKSNPKHTLGGEGNRPNAGIEPKNSLELFEKSYQSGKKRFAIDKEGSIHQFTDSNDGTWHWAGRTGSDQPVAQRLNGNTVPPDVIRHFKLDPKKVKKL